jgi:CheY-like chemotaxis protein
MAARKVLSVGQCGPVHAALVRFLTAHFDVEVVPAKLPADALRALREAGPFALLLVNRKLDEDYSDGLEVIRMARAQADSAAVPAMLVSNYAEAHDEAERAGALRGFGKLELNAATAERLRALLG